jgi:hypothetical protein
MDERREQRINKILNVFQVGIDELTDIFVEIARENPSNTKNEFNELKKKPL